MKKLLVFILTLLLAIGVFAATQIVAFATVDESECTHVDEDNLLHICDLCGEYIGGVDLTFGSDNKLVLEDFWGDVHRLYRFIPEESGLYEIYSHKDDWDGWSTHAYLYNSEYNYIALAYNNGNYNFQMAEWLEAGEVYYLAVLESSSSLIGTEMPITIGFHTAHIDNDNAVNICDFCDYYMADFGLTLGDNEISNNLKNNYLSFVPEVSDSYVISLEITEESYQTISVYNADMELDDFGDIYIKDNIYYSVYNLTAGETYYFNIYRTDAEGDSYTVNLSLHEHVGVTETCQGLLCDCGEYLNYVEYDHRLKDEVTCLGRECIDCFDYFGDPDPNNHGFISSTQTCLGYICYDCDVYTGEPGDHDYSGGQTCKGYYCDDCQEYVGEPGDEHIDFYGDYLCDDCSLYLGIDYTIGSYIFELKNRYVKFVPTETALYSFYSISEIGNNLDLFINDSDLNTMKEAYTSQISENQDDFYMVIELQAGETYYLYIEHYFSSDSTDFTFVIEKHEHEGIETCDGLLCACGIYLDKVQYDHRLDDYQTCIGYRCIDCNNYFGEASDVHSDNIDDNFCSYCKTFFGTDIIVGTHTLDAKDNYWRFVATSDTFYKFYSISDIGIDMDIFIYDSDFEVISFSYDDAQEHNGRDFYISITLKEGETYYIFTRLYESVLDVSKYTFVIEQHEHVNTVETCKGLLCDCGTFLDEVEYDHRLYEVQTCLGYECLDCYEYFGEASENHSDLSETQTCMGYFCYHCGEYTGEGNGVHVDGDDDYIDVCDICKEYLGSATAVVGENIISTSWDKYVCIEFIPSITGGYKIYSDTIYDPKIEVFDSNFESLVYSDDAVGYNFEVIRHFEAGKTYYLAIGSYTGEFDLDMYIEYHSHDDIEQCCIGYYCPVCEEAFGEGNDVHHDGDDSQTNRCDYCMKYLLDYDIDFGDTTIFINRENELFMRFVPENSGLYWIYSTSNSDPEVVLLDSEFNYITYSDDFGGLDFNLLEYLESGETYYFTFKDYHSPAQITVTLEYHEHEYVLTCIGYLCECGDLYGEPGENHRLSEQVTCQGYLCRDCGEYFGEADPDAHVWHYGYCYYHEDVEFPDDVVCEHSWDDGDCEICGDDHDCTPETFDEYGYCVICDEDAGFLVTTNGVSKYYRGLTDALEAAVDGSVLTLLENRATSKVYNIYKEIVFDTNGYRFITDDGGAINIYAYVTFMASGSYGCFDSTINVYENCHFVNGEYREINLYNGLKYSDVIYGCSYANMYDPIRDTFVNLNSVQMDEMDYVGGFILYNDDPHHVLGTAREDATCTENAVEITYCIYCGEIDEVTEIKNTAKGHLWMGAYGEGHKTCAECHISVEDKRYSGDAAREVSAKVTRMVVNATYELITEVVTYVVDEYLPFLKNIDLSAYMNK